MHFLNKMDKIWIVCLIILGIGCLWSAKNAIDNREVIAGILSHTLRIYCIHLNVLEEKCGLHKIKVDNRKPKYAINCEGGWVFPVSPYFHFNPKPLGEFNSDEVTLIRVKQSGHIYSDKKSHWKINWGCKFMIYHNKVPNSDIQYTEINALVFDDKLISLGLERLIAKVHRKTGLPILLVSRPIERIHLYYNNQFICFGDKDDMGYLSLLEMIEHNASK